jgi:hypothetical protein
MDRPKTIISKRREQIILPTIFVSEHANCNTKVPLKLLSEQMRRLDILQHVRSLANLYISFFTYTIQHDGSVV